jgi:Mg2+ and Co2+ transporter CorA
VETVVPAHAKTMQLVDLLDLKQKQANVSEARSTRRSGNSITVFTIVTIIFLPASFMASFFALPITQYPKIDDTFELRYVVKYLGERRYNSCGPFCANIGP